MSTTAAADGLEAALADCRAILTSPAAAMVMDPPVAAAETGLTVPYAPDAADTDEGPRWSPIVMVPIPGLAQLAAIARPPLQVIRAILAVIKAFAQALQAILIGLLDPFRAIILAAYEALRNLLNDLINAGGYLYFDAPGITSPMPTAAEMGIPTNPEADFRAGMGGPKPPPAQDGYAKWASRFGASFDDPGDLDRPVFSDGASVMALFVVMSAPSLDALRQLLYALGQLLNIGAFKLAWEGFKPGPDPDLARARQDPVAPDWDKATLGKLFPPIKALLQIPDALKELLLAGDGLVALLRNLVGALEQKIQVIQRIIDAIDAILALLEALGQAGLKGLFVTTNQGVAGLKQAFVTAKNRPEGAYVGGVCLLAAGPGMKDATILYELFGQGEAWNMVEDAWDQTKEKAEKAWEDAKVAEAAEALGATAEAAAGDLAKAIVDAPAGVVGSLAEAGENAWDAAAKAPQALSDALEDANTTLVDEAAAQGKQKVDELRKKARGSLALGYGRTTGSRIAPEDKKEKP